MVLEFISNFSGFIGNFCTFIGGFKAFISIYPLRKEDEASPFFTLRPFSDQRMKGNHTNGR